MMRKNSGFSVIELLVVIGMIAIICAIAVPNLIGWRAKAQLGKAARDVYGGLHKAKMEAARNNSFCVFRFSAVNVNGIDYGFHIFVDSEPRNYVYDDGVDTFVAGYKEIDYPGVLIDLNFGGGDGMTFPDVAGEPTIAFAPDGLPKNLDDTLSSGSLRFNDGGENGRQISVSLVGNVQISKYEPNP